MNRTKSDLKNAEVILQVLVSLGSRKQIRMNAFFISYSLTKNISNEKTINPIPNILFIQLQRSFRFYNR